MVQTFKLIIIGVVVFGLGYSVGRYLQPTKVIKEVVEVEKLVEHKNVVTVVKEVKRPDGTTETVKTIVDKSETVKDILKTERIEVEASKHDWYIIASRSINSIYSVQVDRRIIGPFFLGARYDTQNNIWVSVGAEF